MADALLCMSGMRLSQMPKDERRRVQEALRTAAVQTLTEHEDTAGFVHDRLGDARGKVMIGRMAASYRLSGSKIRQQCA